jgi:predicted DNA-binding protein (MmcQ/YjbR family)
MLLNAAAETYFRPPYVGHRGWIGIRLDRGVPDDEVAGVIEDAYLTVAPKSLAKSILG